MTVTRALLASALTAVGLLAPAGPAHAAGSYVALGDSYSSGTGTRSYLADGTRCQRSVHAFPALIASSHGHALNFRACSGATTADVGDLQLGALGAATTHVTISVGGNDAGFSSVLTECAKPSWASNCGAAIDRAVSIIDHHVPGRLGALYASLRGRAPQARVVVVGYPRIFNGEDCNAGTYFSPTEEARLNATADRLNTRITAAASGAGFSFSNPTSAFTGHAVCDGVEWLNGLSSPISESYHPNRTGHSSGYTPLVGRRLTGSRTAVTAAVRERARASADRLATQQRQYAEQDAAITPKPFRLPDLRSREIAAAAARAGVDVSSPSSVEAADRRYDRLEQRVG